MVNEAIKRAVNELKAMPKDAQYAYAFGVIGGMAFNLTPDEIQRLHREMSETINESRA